jgi:hypothetical protein
MVICAQHTVSVSCFDGHSRQVGLEFYAPGTVSLRDQMGHSRQTDTDNDFLTSACKHRERERERSS